MPLSIAIATSAPRHLKSASVSGEAGAADRRLIPKVAIEMGATGTPAGHVPERTRKTRQERNAFFQAFNATTLRSRQVSIAKVSLPRVGVRDSSRTSDLKWWEQVWCAKSARGVDLA
jgi:hypothetical protein